MNINDILTLSDNNEYIITSKIDYEGKIYLFLVDINDNKNTKCCYVDNEELVVIRNSEISEDLALRLMNNMIEML